MQLPFLRPQSVTAEHAPGLAAGRVHSMPSSPMAASLSSPKRAGLGTGHLSGTGLARTNSSTGGQPGGPPGAVSQFQQQHEVSLRKNRNHFLATLEQHARDYRCASEKAVAELPVLQEQFILEVEETQNVLEEGVTRQLARITQLRQDYALLVKEASRRHMELQQRRFAGAKVEVPVIPAPTTSGATPSRPSTTSGGANGYPHNPQGPIVSPSPIPPGGGSKPGSVSHAHDQAQQHALGHISPNAYLKTLSPDATHAMSQYAQRPLSRENGGLAALSLSTPASPAGPRHGSTMQDVTARPSDFARLEGMHEKHTSKTRSLHEQGIANRSAEVSGWQQTFAACMGALAQHQSSSLAHLHSCVEEAEAWHTQQRAALGAAHEEVVGECEHLGRQLDSMQQAAAGKLTALLASFLERVLPAGEVGLAEAQAAYTRAAGNARNEHVAALEAAEASFRALVPRHGAMRQHVLAAYSSGLMAHEQTILAAGTHYESRGLPELRRQYDEAESRHRDALAAIRAEHLRSLAAAKESWMGEATALLEEYRARMQELRQQFVLAYEVDVTEV